MKYNSEKLKKTEFDGIIYIRAFWPLHIVCVCHLLQPKQSMNGGSNYEKTVSVCAGMHFVIGNGMHGMHARNWGNC